MSESEQRVVRVPIPVRLIREMDSVIHRGVGGYATRSEFIVDAIQERILEVTIPSGDDDAPTESRRIDAVGLGGPETPRPDGPTHEPSDSFAATALRPPKAGYAIGQTADLSRPEGKPLFGLHNRDYPTLWALVQLAELAHEGPVPVEQLFSEVLRRAWTFGEILLSAERASRQKCSAIFPTNPNKRKAAEAAFRQFAVGDYKRLEDETVTSGPLFEWKLAGLEEGERSDDLQIAVSGLGWQLLEKIRGLTVSEPHPAGPTEAFLSHVAETAPQDFGALMAVIETVGPNGARRAEVLDSMARVWPHWTSNEVATNTAGYIARAREWGLMESKQVESRYQLTARGLGHLGLSLKGETNGNTKP